VLEWIDEDLEKGDDAQGRKESGKARHPVERRESVILPPGYRPPAPDPFLRRPRRRLSTTNLMPEKEPVTEKPGRVQRRVSSVILERDYAAPGDHAPPSTSAAAMAASIAARSSSSGTNKEIVVIGDSNLAMRIVKAVSGIRNRVVYWADQSEPGFTREGDADKRRMSLEIDPESGSRVKVIQLPNDKMLSIEKFVPFALVSHVFVCWNRESRFSDTVFLTMMLSKKQQHLRCYVQTSNETLEDILGNLGAATFSTSRYAFKMLQRDVSPDSGIRAILPAPPLSERSQSK